MSSASRRSGRGKPRPYGIWVFAILLVIVGAGAALAERQPVLKQIDIPHPYYYREMYLPQVTSGPSVAAWSPDGRELVYAMQGSLWRQALGSREAVQLTDGPGYDSEPDWSPDGRYILYTSYRHDALELWLLDLEGGGASALVANGAVNLDARWSPDGSRIAYVSTAFNGRWHVFVLPVSGAKAAGESVRITEEHDSQLPRYYYSKFDQYLSPAWSPDGKELLVISNRGDVWGSGDIWRMEAKAGAPMRMVRKEETNWKAHPDWARDGKRVVYSSYLGRQRNQLWLTTADGGHPLELTYCECDHTAAPVVAGRSPHRLRQQRGRRRLAARRGGSGWSVRDGRSRDAAVSASAGRAAPDGDGCGGQGHAGAALGDGLRRPGLGAGRRLAPRRRRLRPEGAPVRAHVFSRARQRRR